MIINSYNSKIIFVLLILFIPRLASAFGFSNQSDGYLDASAVPQNLGNVVSSAISAQVRGNGYPTPSDRDSVRITSVVVNSVITSRQFTVEFFTWTSSAWVSSSSLFNQCVWADTNCNTTYSGPSFNDIYVYLRLTRNSTATYAPIPNGTKIATVNFEQFSAHGQGVTTSVNFYTRGVIAPANPTCNVKNFDKSVTLPPVRRSDLSSHGVGRYAAATKEFDINLECTDKPKISVKFVGDKMTGIATDDVLANKAIGNDNVGLQILHENAPVKLGTAFQILTSTQTNELLKFNVYYYYKGGAVSSGPINANAEFLFTYN